MIDWQRVTELRDEIGAEDFGDVVELFLEEVAEVIDRLRAAPDPATFEAELHFLKGSALNLGFQALGDICAQGERLAQGGAADKIDITAVIEIYENSTEAFTEQLAREQAA